MFLKEESRPRKNPKFMYFNIFKCIFSLNLLLYEQLQLVLQGLCVTTGIKQTVEVHISHEQVCKRGQMGGLE